MPFIVVGIPSAYNPEYKYERNNDFLPEPTTVTVSEPFRANSHAFKRFLTEEVFPYVNTHYRTSGHTLAIGHSLSASFTLDAFACEDMFDDYFVLSPNLSWDDGHFARGFLNHDFSDGKPRFFFMSMANESEPTGWAPEWRRAWDSTKSAIESAAYPDNVKILIKEYPDYSHMRSYVECLMDALPVYAMYRHTEHISDPTLHPVHIELKMDTPEGDIYITGNQEALANWNPQGVKMRRIDDTTYAIDLELKLPAEYKFTRGSWDNQPYISNSFNGNQRIHHPARATKCYQAF